MSCLNTNYHRLYKIVIYIGHLLYNSIQQENDTVFLSGDTLTVTCIWQAFTCPDYTSMDHCSWCPLTQVSENLSLSASSTHLSSQPCTQCARPISVSSCEPWGCSVCWSISSARGTSWEDVVPVGRRKGFLTWKKDEEISLTSKWKESVGS